MRSFAPVLITFALTGCGSTSSDGGGDGSGNGAQATAVTAGGSFSCALMADRTVKCWGSNFYGQLGDGTTTSTPSPVAVQGLSDVVQVSAGGSFACALRSDGSVWCWGRGQDGQLGDGQDLSSPIPVQVAGLASVTQIACGSEHACAIVGPVGEARCWGTNNVAQLGSNPPLADGSTPLAVAGLIGAKSISTGALHSCVILGDTVNCWGAGPIGIDGAYYTPTPLPNGSGFAALSPSGNSHLCGVLADSRVACWGSNTAGQLGSAEPGYSDQPITVPGLSDVTSISSGTSAVQSLFVFPSSNCAVLANGSVSCWGSNEAGELGDGTTTARAAPAAVAGLNDVTAVAVGANDAIDHSAHVCALHASGEVSCWGSNDLGELGDGTTTSRSTPAKVTF